MTRQQCFVQLSIVTHIELPKTHQAPLGASLLNILFVISMASNQILCNVIYRKHEASTVNHGVRSNMLWGGSLQQPWKACERSNNTEILEENLMLSKTPATWESICLQRPNLKLCLCGNYFKKKNNVSNLPFCSTACTRRKFLVFIRFNGTCPVNRSHHS